MDRWKLLSGTLTVSGAGMACTASLNGVIRQILENPAMYAGLTLTASVENAQVSIGTETGQTAFAESATLTLPSSLTLLFVDVKAAGTIPQWAQLVIGETRAPRSLRLPGDELTLCQRYYEKSYPISVAPGAINRFDSLTYSPAPASGSANIAAGVLFRSEKAIVPAITVYATESTGLPGYVSGIGANTNAVAAAAASYYNTSGIGLISAASGTFPAGAIYRFNWVAEAEL